jgi:hypothetical protein
MPDTLSGAERLPWLTDKAPTAVTPKSRLSGAVLFAAGAASAVIAFGGWSIMQRTAVPSPPVASVETVPLPAPSVSPAVDAAPAAPSAAEREALAPEAAPGAEQAATKPAWQAQPQSNRERPSTVGRGHGEEARDRPIATASTNAPAPVKRFPVVATTAQPPQLWSSRNVAGASGRLVQIGAFGSRQQAKLGWRRMQRSYPAVGRLPAIVVEARNSKGRKFYRFQIGTTSHAHSEVLCQRMQTIDFSCAVIGLPWKAKVER